VMGRRFLATKVFVVKSFLSVMGKDLEFRFSG
jgi:hypothetical protein